MLAVANTPPMDAAPHSPRFARLSVGDGLSQSSVQTILQDRRGLFWFGTQEGLNRYDGYRFTVHRARDQEGFLRDHRITVLVEDSAGDLWVGTARGLYHYELDTGRFDRWGAEAGELGIVSAIATTDGHIFFAATDGQLWKLDRGDAGRRALPVNDGPFAKLRGVTALAAGAESAVWVAAQGRLFRLDMRASEPTRQLVETLRDLGTVTVLARDQRDHLWIGRTSGELLRYRPQAGATDRYAQVSGRTLAILPANTGELWIGLRNGGLSRLEPTSGAVEVYRHDPDEPSSISGDDVASIYEDAAGSVWIGSWNGGVDRFDPHAQALRTFRPRLHIPDSLPPGDVAVLTEAPDATLWLAMRNGRLISGDPRSGRFRAVATLPPKGVALGIGWWERRVLLGMDGGLAVFDASSGRELPLDRALQAHRLGERRIAALRIGGDAAWIGSGTEVLRVTRPMPSGPWAVEQVTLPNGGLVSALSIVGDGRLWIGTDTADVLLVEWSSGTARVVLGRLPLEQAARESLADHRPITALHEDRLGRLWVATRRGLGRIDMASQRVSWLTETDGLPSTDIAGITAAGDGQLWVAHNRGLTRIDPADGTMRHFGGHEGAQENGYAENAWATGASGLIYFAGQGVTAFDPREIRTSPTPPRVLFTALEILHRVVVPAWLDPTSPLQRAIEAQEEVTLAPDANVFSVEMAALHYIDPPSNRLRYRLEGFDPAWIETGMDNRIATYTNLPPGRYVLHASAGTKDGVWGEQDATLVIRIQPPWWRTRTALAVWIAMSLAAVALVVAGARRRARVKQALLERETLRRERLADPLTGLHDRRFLMTYLQHEEPGLQIEQRRATGPIYEWGPWRFEPADYRLMRDGALLPLPNKTLDLLSLLLRQSPHLVTKEEILASVWSNAAVEEGNIAVHIAALRKALDEDESQSAIETVRGRGYRFVHALDNPPRPADR